MKKPLLPSRKIFIEWPANTIKDFPVGLGNIISDYENMDLITPNWLLLRRNNDWSPAAAMEVAGNPGRILKENIKIYNIWFEAWLISHVPDELS